MTVGELREKAKRGVELTHPEAEFLKKVKKDLYYSDYVEIPAYDLLTEKEKDARLIKALTEQGDKKAENKAKHARC